MKTRKKLLLALLSVTCVTAGALGLAACGDKNPNTADTRNPDIVAVYTKYVAYAESNNETVLTYEQWLDSIKGAAGDPGDPGADGATWLSGAENPAASAGKTGDFYLNTATFDVFKKGADGWGAAICNIKGADGGSASKGDDGATWLTGAEAPAADAGKVGDLYLNTATSDVYQKTADGWGTPICNIKGATGGAGSAGSDGNGIADITLLGSMLIIKYTDPNKPNTNISLPAAIFHTHSYESNEKDYYDVALIEPTEEKTGLGYKVCQGTISGEKCEHVEIVVIPELTHCGTQRDPIWIQNELKESQGSSWKLLLPESGTTYFEFKPDKDGYFYVTTPTTVDDWWGDYYYACNFNVQNGTARYTQRDSQSFIAAYCTVKAGQTVTIDATRSSQYDGFKGPDEQRYVEFTYYAADETQEYSVTVTDPAGAPVSGASVKAYTKDGNKYTEVANVAAVTTGTDGVAKFDLPMNVYYFAVTPSEAYVPVEAGATGTGIGLKPTGLETTIKLEAAGDGSETIESISNFITKSFKANIEYTFIVSDGDDFEDIGYVVYVSSGYFDYVEYNGFVLVENGVIKDEEYAAMLGMDTNEDGKVNYMGIWSGTVFKVSQDCSGGFMPDLGDEEEDW